MRSCKKSALLGALAVAAATLAACSSTYYAAPVPSSQQNQDYQSNQRLNPDISSHSRGW